MKKTELKCNCVDCGKKISQEAKRCKKCYYKFFKGKNHPNYKDGKCLKKNLCIDCGKQLVSFYARQCIPCYSKWKRGKNNSMFGVHRFGKKAASYIDGRTSNPRYCKEKNCNNKITYQNWKYGEGRCVICANKRASKKMKIHWQDEKYRERILKAVFEGRKITPNRPEKALNKLLKQLLQNEYKFVGNGKVILGGFCPDFINVNGQKKVIELYGCYWHKCPKCGFGDKLVKDRKRIRVYKKYGYKTLIVWEHELKNLKKLEKKVKTFNYA